MTFGHTPTKSKAFELFFGQQKYFITSKKKAKLKSCFRSINIQNCTVIKEQYKSGEIERTLACLALRKLAINMQSRGLPWLDGALVSKWGHLACKIP